ncbi:GMC oxidoreductase [Kroppenstedtia eburnea]|uniref:GMC oxidoreductase n=1 Tax=Kroppenstedtia eburnea TaxID=714067 RepID=A0A1N7J0F5_9BACL|nr:GMC oxidoreductase [Kroppenstedtia eburnea]
MFLKYMLVPLALWDLGGKLNVTRLFLCKHGNGGFGHSPLSDLRQTIMAPLRPWNRRAGNPFKVMHMSIIESSCYSIVMDMARCIFGNVCSSGQGGIVDRQGRVHGVKDLIVVDDSIVPFTVDGNTSAPAFPIGLTIAQQLLKQRGNRRFPLDQENVSEQ